MNNERDCGGCTACCKTHGVFSILKMAGSWCKHCDVGSGCQIYTDRPIECREFSCVWRLGMGGGLESRPDKSGIVPVYSEFPVIGMVLSFWEFREGALEHEYTKSWTKQNLSKGRFVAHVPISGNHKLFLPRGVKISDAKVFENIVIDMSDKKLDVIPFQKNRF